MKFSTIEQAKKAIVTLPRDNGNRRIFPVAVKKAIIELFNTLQVTRVAFCDELGLGTANFDNWRKAYNDGLFDDTLGAICVSRTAKKASSDILAQLEQEKRIIERKIAIIKEAKTLGLTIAA